MLVLHLQLLKILVLLIGVQGALVDQVAGGFFLSLKYISVRMY
jgi:hypothetical protein